MSKALVVQTAFLGDTVLTTPLLQLLAEGGSQVDAVCRPDSVELIESHPAVSNVIPYDKRGSHKGFRGLVGLAKSISPLGYDTAYLPHRSWRTAFLARMAGIPRRVGFHDAPAKLLYTECVHPGGTFEFEKIGRLSGSENIPHPKVPLTERDREVASRALSRAGLENEVTFVVVAPGARWPTKVWPYYQHLVELLCEHVPVVSVGSEVERGLIAGSRVVDLAGSLTVRESAAVIARATLAVTNDSAPMHLANAVRTPVVAIFGPTDPRAGFGPVGERDVVVGIGDLDCRPCSTHGGRKCPLGHHRCMNDLPAHEVAAKTLQLI